MTKHYTALLLLALMAIPGMLAAQQADSIVAKLIVVGDAGEFEPGSSQHPVLRDIRSRITDSSRPATAILYLGDNIYPIGMRPAGTARPHRVPARRSGAETVPRRFQKRHLSFRSPRVGKSGKIVQLH